MTDLEAKPIAILEPEKRPLDAWRTTKDEVVELLNRIEKIRVEVRGYNEDGHKVWEIYYDE